MKKHNNREDGFKRIAEETKHKDFKLARKK